jgi:ATP-dependent DNA helicase RecQ
LFRIIADIWLINMIHQLLKQYWGFSTFRTLQEEIIQSVLHGNDTLALLPTGGGKSICFQVPALAKEGICIVISPLIALMKDQVEGLKKKNIPALAITSAMRKPEIDVAFDNCVYGNIKFLYLSPERLETDLAKVRIQKMNVNLIAVDEAHCVSQWGYDFRPSYLKITELRKWLPEVPLLALTATATHQVVEDIQKKLAFKKENIYRKSFERKNLSYSVLYEENKLARMLKIITKVNGSGIVYVRNRKKAKEVADFLYRSNIQADFYHAGLEPTLRDKKQEDWIQNKTRVIVCTNAFGMGIDKPDVRLVLHLDLPDTPEAYFQEAGRAGRDEKKSFAVLLYNASDREGLEKYFQLSYPSIEEIKKTYQALANYLQLPIGAGVGSLFEFDISDFCKNYNLNPLISFNAIKFLEREGYLSLSDAFFNPSKIHFRLNKDDLYTFQVEHPAQDHFIKLLLRSYSGVFDGFVKISETELAKRYEKPPEAIKKALKYLDEAGILSYIPQTENPQLLFLVERIDAKDIRISPENYKTRKELATSRLNAMLHYAESKIHCRSTLLLNYFGERHSSPCGICDVCLNEKRTNLHEKEVNEIATQIKSLLSKNELLLNEVVHSIKGHSEAKVIKTIQWLMDTEVVSKDEKQLLSLAQPE